MYRKFGFVIAAVAALALSSQSADAKWRKHHHDKALFWTSLGVGAAATAGYFAIKDSHNVSNAAAWGLSTVGCLAVAPMVGTLVVKRPLTYREAHVMAASCVLPVVGGWLVNRMYDHHPRWPK